MCGGKVVYFKHHDYKDAERMIKKHLPRNRGKRVVWMVVESIYRYQAPARCPPPPLSLPRDECICVLSVSVCMSLCVCVCIDSMDGDIAHLPSVWGLCQKYDMKLIIDEAHGLGVLGKTGRYESPESWLPAAPSLPPS